MKYAINEGGNLMKYAINKLLLLAFAVSYVVNTTVCNVRACDLCYPNTTPCRVHTCDFKNAVSYMLGESHSDNGTKTSICLSHDNSVMMIYSDAKTASSILSLSVSSIIQKYGTDEFSTITESPIMKAKALQWGEKAFEISMFSPLHILADSMSSPLITLLIAKTANENKKTIRNLVVNFIYKAIEGSFLGMENSLKDEDSKIKILDAFQQNRAYIAMAMRRIFDIYSDNGDTKDYIHHSKIIHQRMDELGTLLVGAEQFGSINEGVRNYLMQGKIEAICTFLKFATCIYLPECMLIDPFSFYGFFEHIIKAEHFNEETKEHKSYFVLKGENQEFPFIYQTMKDLFNGNVSFKALSVENADLVVDFKYKNKPNALEKMVYQNDHNWWTVDIVRVVLREYITSGKKIYKFVTTYPTNGKRKETSLVQNFTNVLNLYGSKGKSGGMAKGGRRAEALSIMKYNENCREKILSTTFELLGKTGDVPPSEFLF
jgi:hypothetical protein